MGEDRIRPFDNGTQYLGWEDRNCARCRKGLGEPGEDFKCDLQAALAIACVGDGKVSKTCWKRIGGEAHPMAYTWDCPEREPVHDEMTPGLFDGKQERKEDIA